MMEMRFIWYIDTDDDVSVVGGVIVVGTVLVSKKKVLISWGRRVTVNSPTPVLLFSLFCVMT